MQIAPRSAKLWLTLGRALAGVQGMPLRWLRALGQVALALLWAGQQPLAQTHPSMPWIRLWEVQSKRGQPLDGLLMCGQGVVRNHWSLASACLLLGDWAWPLVAGRGVARPQDG
jgi:hypothetical protein